MKISLENVGSIIRGNISIEENILNVKYGYNGIGKTTISKAIEKKIKGEDLTDLKPFGSELEPQIDIAGGNISNYLIFNQDYCDNFLFKEDIVNNSFELIVNSNEYRRISKVVDEYFADLLEILRNPKLFKVKQELSDFRDSIKFNKIGKDGSLSLNARCKINIGKKFNDIDSLLSNDAKDYCDYLKMNESNKWLDWFKQGVDIIKQNKIEKCPFCNGKLPKDFISKVDIVLNSVESNGLKARLENSKNANNILLYLSDSDREKFNSYIFNNNDFAQDDLISLNEIYQLVNGEINKIDYLLNLNSIKLKKLYDNGVLEESIKNNKLLTKDFYNSLDEECKDALSSINKCIDDIDNNIAEISTAIKELSSNMSKSISDNENYVKEFMKMSGIPYYFEIIEENGKYRSILKPNNENIEINHRCLSYGEKNAISLILFSLEARNVDLIILDDPVSSFDNLKKFALIYYLFSMPNAVFTDKTVLLFTHDFEIVIDLIFKHELNCCNFNCYYMFNKSGIFNELEIKEKKLKNIYDKWKKDAKNESKNKLVRIVSLRKYFELNNDFSKHSNEWNILSCVEHNHDDMLKKENGKLLPIETKDINDAISNIKKFINDFDFDFYKKEIHNVENLRQWYKSCVSDLDRLMILRVYIMNTNLIDEKSSTNAAFMNFIYETYHIENNELISLDDTKYSIVPDYIMKKCDEIINA